MVAHLKGQHGLKYVYAWHAMMGFWGGLSAAEREMSKYAARPVMPVPSQSLLVRRYMCTSACTCVSTCVGDVRGWGFMSLQLFLSFWQQQQQQPFSRGRGALYAGTLHDNCFCAISCVTCQTLPKRSRDTL